MNTKEIYDVKITNADPSALGLFGLAMVTLVASTQKLGITTGVSFILPWAIFLGAFAQLFACINDSKRNNTFGTTAFGGYALFWFAVGFSWMIKLGVLNQKLADQADAKQLGIAFIGYLIFSLYLTIAATRTNKVLFMIFLAIDVLFIALSFSTLGVAENITKTIAGCAEMVISILSFYASAAAVINIQFEEVVLPIGSAFSRNSISNSNMDNLKKEMKKDVLAVGDEVFGEENKISSSEGSTTKFGVQVNFSGKEDSGLKTMQYNANLVIDNSTLLIQNKKEPKILGEHFEEFST